MIPRFAPLKTKSFLIPTFLLLTLACVAARAQNPPPQPRQVGPSLLIRWKGTPGVERYRLQLATDEAFKDIVYDRAVVGRQHVVTELPPGNYFWRVAPAARETGTYSAPARVTLGGSVVGVAVADVVIPSDTGGWRTATGDVLRPVPAALRSGGIVDLIAVNAEGNIFAVDGVSGIALWTARYRPDARRGDAPGESPMPFAPLVISPSPGETRIVVGFDGGVRALRGDSGRELWRARLQGRVTGGVVADLKGDGATQIALVTANPERLYLLDGASGRVVAEQKLEAEVIGSPFALTTGVTRGLVLALTNERLEVRAADGSLTYETKTRDKLTTAPLVVTRGSMSVIVVGTDKGLTALNLPELRTLGNIVADDDSARGILNAADMDGDGVLEIIMVTKRGRVALVSTADGNVRWYAEGATDAASASFADLNSDGILDVIVPGGSAFAIGFSGRDGTLIWKVEEGGRAGGASAAVGARSLVVAPTLNEGAVLVGSDPSRMGLRAVELPKGALKASR